MIIVLACKLFQQFIWRKFDVLIKVSEDCKHFSVIKKEPLLNGFTASNWVRIYFFFFLKRQSGLESWLEQIWFNTTWGCFYNNVFAKSFILFFPVLNINPPLLPTITSGITLQKNLFLLNLKMVPHKFQTFWQNLFIGFDKFFSHSFLCRKTYFLASWFEKKNWSYNSWCFHMF